MHMYMSTHMQIYMSTHMYIYMSTHMYIYMSAHMIYMSAALPADVPSGIYIQRSLIICSSEVYPYAYLYVYPYASLLDIYAARHIGRQRRREV